MPTAWMTSSMACRHGHTEMLRYQVRFAKARHESTLSGYVDGVRHVKARTELEAIAKVRHLVPGSFGHWVNGNATELV